MCQGGVFDRIESMCLIQGNMGQIHNCQKVYHTHDPTEKQPYRCYSCADGYHLSLSQSECIKNFDNNTAETVIEHCISYNGPWCKRCKSGVEVSGGNKINYILTDANNCIPEPKGWENENCAFAVYADHDHGFDRTIKTCKACREGYYLDAGSSKCLRKDACENVVINGKTLPQKYIYLYNDIETKVCGVEVTDCLLYRDKVGNCYECDTKNNSYLGILRNSDGFA